MDKHLHNPTFSVDVEEAKPVAVNFGLDKAFSHYRFRSYCGDDTGLKRFKEMVGEVLYTACRRLDNSSRERRRVTRKRFNSLISNGWCWFLTLTFTDEVLANTSHETRRRYVARYLKFLGGRYVGNVDYGKKNGREHYHAIVEMAAVDNPDFTSWKYGFYKAIPIGDAESDAKAITTYVTKLTAHALKKTTSGRYFRERLIYGRSERKSKIPPKWLVVEGDKPND